MPATIIEISHLKNQLNNQVIHQDVNLTVNANEIVAIVGGSGSGKTVLLRTILMLNQPTAGSIKVFDVDIINCNHESAEKIRHRWGVLFQHSALFSGLTVLENVLFPLQTFSRLPLKLQQEIALFKIFLVGLDANAALKYPAELSGGMQKRAALARALALDPELLFLDEPTTGLDPSSAGALDELILKLRDTLKLTVVMITHDIDTLWRVTDRVAFLGEGKILAATPIDQLIQNKHALIQAYFSGSRTKRLREEATDGK